MKNDYIRRIKCKLKNIFRIHMLTLFKRQEDLGLFLSSLILGSWPRYIEELMIKMTDGVFPGGLMVKTLPSNAGDVQSLVGELRSHKPHGQRPKHKTEARSSIVTHSRKTLKTFHIKKNLKKKNPTDSNIRASSFTSMSLFPKLIMKQRFTLHNV